MLVTIVSLYLDSKRQMLIEARFNSSFGTILYRFLFCIYLLYFAVAAGVTLVSAFLFFWIIETFVTIYL